MQTGSRRVLTDSFKSVGGGNGGVHVQAADKEVAGIHWAHGGELPGKEGCARRQVKDPVARLDVRLRFVGKHGQVQVQSCANEGLGNPAR